MATLTAIFLDTGPLGIITKRFGAADGDACRLWADKCIVAGVSLFVPAIAYYELRREYERRGSFGAIARLDNFCNAVLGRYIPLTDSALRLGCGLWASVRNSGLPTADPHELDCDVLLAAQVIDAGYTPAQVIVATTNVGHLSRFVPAEEWEKIAP